PIASLRLLSVAARLLRHRRLPIPGRRGRRHRGLAIAASRFSLLRVHGLLAVALRVAPRGLVLSHQAAPFVTVSPPTLAVPTDARLGRTPHLKAMSVVDGSVRTGRMGAAGLLGIRTHPTTTAGPHLSAGFDSPDT